MFILNGRLNFNARTISTCATVTVITDGFTFTSQPIVIFDSYIARRNK